MTKRERELVVELLRCAADVAASDSWGFDDCATAAIRHLGSGKTTCKFATDAAACVAGGLSGGDNADEFIAIVLEAAARVEEGSYP